MRRTPDSRTRRDLLARALLAAASVTAGRPAIAQAWPQRPVRLVVGQQAGASTDTIARLIAPRLAERLGQSFVVENRPGGATRAAMDAAIRAQPDGQVFAIANAVSATFPLILDDYPFVPGKDFAPVTLLGRAPSFLAIRSSLPVQDAAGFVRHVKSVGDRLVLGHGGIGSNPHLSAVALARSLGSRPVQIAYKGNAPTAVALAAGEVDFAMLDYASVRGFVEGGKVRLLAVSEPRRFSPEPSVPTGAEAGLTADIEGLTVWFMLVAAPRTPPAIVELLNRQVRAVLSSPDITQRLLALGIEPEPTSIEDTTAFFVAQRDKIARLTRELDISLRN